MPLSALLFRIFRTPWRAAAFSAAAALLLGPATAAQAESAPRFTEDGRLIRPDGYREWVFVGASLGMTYEDGAAEEGQRRFHNVYLHPSAYQEYKSSGVFPDSTILVLEILSAASQASINRDGYFEDKVVALEAAVKDTRRFPERWAYFSFDTPEGPSAPSAAPFPKERCWSCHSEHAAVDNVFTQFYPALREAR